jgi:hypothetical protein
MLLSRSAFESNCKLVDNAHVLLCRQFNHPDDLMESNGIVRIEAEVRSKQQFCDTGHCVLTRPRS